MRRDAAWALGAMLVAGSAACGRTNVDGEPGELSADASLLDAALDSSVEYVDAGGADATLDANTEAGTDASADASTSDAAEQHVPCDTCTRGNQECGGQGILTCVVGDAGCAAWAPAVACRSDVPCCVPCTHEYDCPLGSLGNPCEQDTDCASNACDAVTHECVTSRCADHRQDGDETDVDCGGSLCNSCRVGQGCQANFDCVGGAACTPSHVCE